MNWTDLQEIVQKIVEKRYSDKEAFHYFLGSAILYALSCFLLGEEYENGYKLVVIPALCIIIITSILSFKTYTKNGGTDFFKDYFALNWVIGFHLFSLGLFFISLLFVLGPVFFHTYDFKSFTSENSPFWIGFELGFGTIFYFLLYRSFKRVSLGKPYKSKR
jgi:hypothetical protein